MFCSISSRTSLLTTFFQNADPTILSSFLNHAFTVHPSLAHVNFIILTLFHISEDAEFTWEQFLCFLASSYEYFQEWKKTDSASKIYQKAISEINLIVDQAYIKKGSIIAQDPILSTLRAQANNYLLSPEELFNSVLHRVNFELKKLEKRADSLHYRYLNEFFILLNNVQQRSLILASLQKCRFDKKEFNLFLSHSIIMGADSGIYVLLNTFSQHEQDCLSTHSQINPEMINLIMDDRGKTLIGEGSFGKIRMAMAIVPNSKHETSLIPGSIICVKKAGSKRKARDKLEIWESTWNDYCSIDFLEDAPEIFDMKITDDCHKMLQGYCFQRLLMLPNGNIFKRNKVYQKWIHVKHYFIGIFKLMIKLHERDICMTDLKPANTLYDKQTLTTKLVDLAGAVRNVDLRSCKVRHVTEATPMYTAPELKNSNDLETIVDLLQCISWTVGHMMEEICKLMKEFIEPVSDSKFQLIKDEISILIKDLKIKRISLEEGLKRLMEIPELEQAIVKNFEAYMDLLKTRLNTEDADIRDILGLKKDIYALRKCFNDKMKASERNSDLNVYDPLTDDSINDLLPCMRKLLQIDELSNFKKEVVILFGSAGSGKSSVLQKLFIEAVDSWTIGDPIPIFMNLSILYDLKDYWRNLKDSLGLEHLNFEDLIKQPLKLFLDSLDESRMDLRIITNILHSFSSYANVSSVKIMVTCRTGYLEEENEQTRLKENIKCNKRYIIPLNHFFFNDKSNLEKLITLYLHQLEKKQGNELTDLASAYLLKINEFHLKEIMKTTQMIFIILAIIPTLMKIKPTSPRQEIDFLAVYQLYLEKNLENEISRSTDEAIKKKSVSWFMQVGVLLAETMMLTKRATNQLRKKDVLNFLSHPLLAEIGETYNQKHPLIEHISIYNILRTLNINIHLLQKPPFEKITLSFPHDTIKNYFLARGMDRKLHNGDEFPEWISHRLVTGDQNIVRFMVETIKKSSKLAAASERAILSTKQSDDPKLITRAANLITFLVASNYSFFGKDLSHIKIRGANISDGIFHGCNFNYADLSNVVLNNVKMDNVSFQKTNLEDVVLDVYPYFGGHTSYVNSVAFSSVGKKMASGSDDKTIRIWDCESGKEIKKLEGHRNFVTSVAFSFDGKQLISGSNDGTARIWNVDNGREFKKFEDHLSIVTSVAFSFDGRKVVSGCNDRIVRIWNAMTGKLIKKYEHQYSVTSVAFSFDGKKVVCGSKDAVIVRHLQNDKEIKTLRYKNYFEVNSVAFSSDGRKVISGNGLFIILWDLESGKELKKYQGHAYPVSSVALSSDGKKLVSGSYDETVRIWDVENEKELKKFEDHTGRVNSVAFSLDGRKVVSGSADKTVRLYDLEEVTELKKYEGHSNWVLSVAFSADGKRVVSGSVDKTVRIWDAENGKELRKYEGHTEHVRSVSFSFDGNKVVSGSSDCTIRIWDVDNEQEAKIYTGHSDSVTSVAFSFDGDKVVSGSSMIDKTVRIWDVESGKELKKYEGHSDYITSVAFSSDGKKVVSGSNDKTVRIWDIESGKEFIKCEGHTVGVNTVAFSSDGTKIVSGSYDKTVRIWDVENGKELKKYEGHVNRVISVAFSTDGKKVISGSGDKTVRIWDVESGKEIKKYENHKNMVDSVAFSSDGTKIVCADAKIIRFYLPLYENKNSSLIISSSATPLSCLNCINYENALNCSNRLMALFNQNNENNG